MGTMEPSGSSSLRSEYLYHYFEKATGPFKNLSGLPDGQAQKVLARIRASGTIMAAHRFDGYMRRRRELEEVARALFVQKGGTPKRKYPDYMVVGECPWLATWYRESDYLRIPVARFDPMTISFSYGDLFPTFSDRARDGREYRRQIYTLEEITEVIERHGLPQHWNPDGALGPERYVEVQVWDDVPVPWRLAR